MPFPSLDEYDCTLSLFNPYDERCAGKIAIRSALGSVLCEKRFELKPHASLLFNLNSGQCSLQTPGHGPPATVHSGNGLLSVTNDEGTAKGFVYLMIRARESERFSVEHPIHQGVVAPKAAPGAIRC